MGGYTKNLRKWNDYQSLVKRVRKINSNAAVYMMSRECRKSRHFEYSDRLSNCFIWVFTPQGHTYWKTINIALTGF